MRLITEAYWPLVALVSVIVLRGKLKNFAFEYGDKKLSMELDQAEKLANRIDMQLRSSEHVDGEEPVLELQSVIDRSQDAFAEPRESIESMYTAVRHALETKLDDKKAGAIVGWSPRDLAAILAYRGVIDSSVYDGIIGLQRLYAAAMDSGAKVEEESVRSFKRLASSIMLGMES